MKRILLSFWFCFIAGALIVVSLFYLIASGKMGYMPSFEELENPNSSISTEVISTDNQIIGKFYLENRSNIVLKISIPTCAMPCSQQKTSVFLSTPGSIFARCCV